MYSTHDNRKMSALPTLMIKGKLVSPDNDPSQQKILNEYIPYEYILEWFKARLNLTGLENRVLILKSETASGKSTLLPPKIYEAFIHGKGNVPGIICTQPRVLTAIENVSQMVANYSSFLRLGKTIGWSTQHNKFRPESFGLLSATVGTLTQQLKTMTDEALMKKYRFILIDETHERDLQIDLTICMLKSMLLRLKNNPNCPFVVLMSATFEPESFLKYFSNVVVNATSTEITKIPVTRNGNFIWCRGEAAGFDEMWDWNQGRTVNNYPSAAAEIVEKICTEGKDEDPLRADILIFLPGKAEFEETARVLDIVNAKLASKGIGVFSLLQIDGDAVKRNSRDNRYLNVPVSEHEVMIGSKTYLPTRRLILTTVVAETGLTLNNLKYVIDSGYNRETEYNPTLGINALLTKPIPQSRMKQRRGRAGRKFKGVFYPLYPQYIYDKLQVQQFPQILTADITPIILDIIFEQLRAKMSAGDRDPTFDINNIDLVDVPSPDALIAAIEKLYAIGFITLNAPKWPGPTLADAKSIVDNNDRNDSNDNNDNTHNPIRLGFTRMGAIAAVVASPTLTPEALRMFFAAYSWGVEITDIVTIIAYCNLDPHIGLAARADAVTGAAQKKAPRPTADWNKIYSHGMTIKIEPAKIRLMIMDEFIDGIILFNAAKNNCIGDDPLANLERWCKQCRISMEFVMGFIAERDSLLEHLLANEFNMFTRTKKLVDTPVAEITECVTRIKHCIYDGYRNCTLVYDPTINKYKSPHGVSVLPPKLLHAEPGSIGAKVASKVKPKYIVTTRLGTKYNRENDIYDVVTGPVSVLDGFVAPDLEFTL